MAARLGKQEGSIERERLIESMLRASTAAEMDRAARRAEEWLRRHPHDTAVMSAAEQLYMMRTALNLTR